MNKSLMKKNLILSSLNSMLVTLPSPLNINIWWNMGSMLGLYLGIQLISGIFLSMHYTSHVDYSFFSVMHIMQDINYGWFMRLVHMNGASFFFISVYLHIGRGVYYGSYKLIYVWFIGVMILLMMMGIAFLGYILPWGQMSFWGATVITNLISVIPFWGSVIVEWLWGGFSIGNSTLNRFYSFHFLLPFILVMMVILHLIYLHEKGSNNPLGLNSNFNKIIFHKYFSLKDLLGYLIMLILFMYIILLNPYILGDPDNFLMANPMVTPIHIQPEWYFLFAYSILRSIPNKMGGVLGLLFSILILLILPLLSLNMKFQGLIFYPLNQFLFWFFFFNLLLLTWLGSQGVEYPFIMLGQISMIIYFMYYFIDYYFKKIWDLIY